MVVTMAELVLGSLRNRSEEDVEDSLIVPWAKSVPLELSDPPVVPVSYTHLTLPTT